jgi:GNAT superfamily N-acetyltransferase
MAANPRIHIRMMRPEEKRAVRRIAWRAFPWTARIFMSLSPHVLVAETITGPDDEGPSRLMGGVVLELFQLPQKAKARPADEQLKGGLVSWLFVDPDAQGLGAGQALVEGAIAFFQEQGCAEVFSCVEGYNTSSSRLFSTRGFERLSPGVQFARYGLWGTILVWLHTFHYIDIGHFLWARPADPAPGRPVLQWWGTLLGNIIIGYLALGRLAAFRYRPEWLVALPLTVLILLGVRFGAMWLAARHRGVTLRYRAWESGFPLGVVLALAFGAFYPSPGSLYPPGDDWRYRDWLPDLGPIALAGASTVLGLTLLTAGAVALGGPAEWVIWLVPATVLTRSLLTLEILLPFFPLECYNGRRVWEWNRMAWVVLAALAVITLVLF